MTEHVSEKSADHKATPQPAHRTWVTPAVRRIELTSAAGIAGTNVPTDAYSDT